jgi:hypothetical protein
MQNRKILGTYFPQIINAIKALNLTNPEKAQSELTKEEEEKENQRLLVIHELATRTMDIIDTSLIFHPFELKKKGREFDSFMKEKVAEITDKPIVEMEFYDSYAECGLALLDIAISSKELLHIAVLIRACIKEAADDPQKLINEFPGAGLVNLFPERKANVVRLLTESRGYGLSLLHLKDNETLSEKSKQNAKQNNRPILIKRDTQYTLYGNPKKACSLSLIKLKNSEKLSEEHKKNAKDQKTPILIEKNNIFTFYGDRENDGKWTETRIDKKFVPEKLIEHFEHLVVKEKIQSDDPLLGGLLEAFKKGHAAMNGEWTETTIPKEILSENLIPYFNQLTEEKETIIEGNDPLFNTLSLSEIQKKGHAPAKTECLPQLTAKITAFVAAWKEEEEKKLKNLLDANKFEDEAAKLLPELDKNTPPPTSLDIQSNISKIEQFLNGLNQHIQKIEQAKEAVALCAGEEPEAACQAIKQQYDEAIKKRRQLKNTWVTKKGELENNLSKDIDLIVRSMIELKGEIQQQEEKIRIQETNTNKPRSTAAKTGPNADTRGAPLKLSWVAKVTDFAKKIGASKIRKEPPATVTVETTKLPNTNQAPALQANEEARKSLLAKKTLLETCLKNYATQEEKKLNQEYTKLEKAINETSELLKTTINNALQEQSEPDLNSLAQNSDKIKNQHTENLEKIAALSAKLIPFQDKLNSFTQLGIKTPDIATLQGNLTNLTTRNAQNNSLINRLTIDPESRGDPLYQQIKQMKVYGEHLQKIDAEKGEAVVKLASLLTLRANSYFCLEDSEKTLTIFNDFAKKFRTLLHGKDALMSTHREIWKPIIANIAIALSGIGLLLIAAQLIHSKLTTNTASFFFAKTKRQMLIDAVDISANKISVPTA